MAILEGGAALPVTTGGQGITEARVAAVPVYVVSGGPVLGQRARRVVVVTSGPVVGRAAIPVYDAGAGALYSAEAALPVYVVQGSLGADPAMAYTNKVKALNPIVYWPMAEASGTVIQDESGNGRNGAYTGVTLGNAGIGDGRTSAAFDGATAYANVYSASLAAAFTPAEFSIGGWFQVNGAGVWTDASTRRFVYFAVDSNNRVYLEKTTTNNQLQCVYVAGATTKNVLFATPAPLGFFFFMVTISKSGDAMKLYYKDATTPIAQVGATQTGLGTWVGALLSTTTLIGAQTQVPNNAWFGRGAHVPVFASALSLAQVTTLATVP